MRLASLTLLVALASPAAALAANQGAAATFGQKGQMMPSGNVTFGLNVSSPPGGGNSTTTTSMLLAPGLLYFVADDFAVGGRLTLGYSSWSSGGATGSASTFGLAPTAGYRFGIGSAVSIMPQGSLIFATNSTSNNTGSTRLTMEVYVPFMWHIVPHFFIGAGPYLDFDLYATRRANNVSGDDAKNVASGVTTTLGGWF